MLDLDAIKARCEAATPGPWSVRIDHNSIYPVQFSGHVRRENADADAEFIAAARDDIPALVAEVERLRSELDAFALFTGSGEIDQGR